MPTLNQVIDALARSYKKDELRHIFLWMKEQFAALDQKGHQWEIAAKDRKNFYNLSDKSKIGEYVSGIAPFIHHGPTFLAMLQEIEGEEAVQALHYLCLEDDITLNDFRKRFRTLRDLFQHTPKVNSYTHLESRILRDGFAGFLKMSSKSGTYYYSQRQPDLEEEGKWIYLSLPEEMVTLLLQILPRPENAVLKPVSEKDLVLKAKDRRWLVRTEPNIMQEVQSIYDFNMAGLVKELQSGKFSEPDLKKMQKAADIQEWYGPDAGHKRLYPMRTRLLNQLCALVDPAPSPLDTLARILIKIQDPPKPRYNQMPKSWFSELDHLLELKGVEAYLYDYYYQPQAIGPFFYHWLFKLPKALQEGWIEVESLLLNERYEGWGPQFNEHQIKSISRNLYYTKAGEYGNTKAYLNTMQLRRRFLIEPLIRGYIGMLSALGMADVLCETPDLTTLGKTYHSVFDGIVAFRLTALGRFLLGIEKDYEVKIEATKEATITVSDTDMMVLLDQEDMVKSKVLAQYAETISPRRYQVTSASFLQGCNSHNDLLDRINNFKMAVGKNTLPPHWEDFFQSLLQRIVSLKPLAKIHIFQLPASNKNLQRLVGSHPDFRNIVQKAEGMRILVEEGNMRKFKQLLKDHGYLLT
jgi:hypothetical protein